MPGIHPTALVSQKARLGVNVEVGPFSIIHDGVTIGAGTVIGSHCEIGIPTPLAQTASLEIGPNGLIRSHSILYIGSTIGSDLKTGHHVTIRERTHAGIHLQVGSFSDIQGHCEIGDYVKMQSHVFVGHKSVIHDYVWLFPYAMLTNDPHPPSEYLIGCTLEEFASIATNAVILPGVRVGRGAFVGAMTLVRDDVPADTICVGVPGKNVGPTSKIKHKETGLPAYPWRRHFHRGYPAEAVALWKAEFDDGSGD